VHGDAGERADREARRPEHRGLAGTGGEERGHDRDPGTLRDRGEEVGEDAEEATRPGSGDAHETTSRSGVRQPPSSRIVPARACGAAATAGATARRRPSPAGCRSARIDVR